MAVKESPSARSSCASPPLLRPLLLPRGTRSGTRDTSVVQKGAWPGDFGNREDKGQVEGGRDADVVAISQYGSARIESLCLVSGQVS